MRQNDERYSEILSQIRTKEDADLLLGEIDNLLVSLYRVKGSMFEEVLREKVRVGVAQVITGAVPKSIPGKEEFLRGLKECLGELKPLKLTLAFEPTSQTVEKIFSWVCQNLDENIVLEIDTDQSILAGAIVTFEGAYEDLSLRSVFEEKFGGERGEAS